MMNSQFSNIKSIDFQPRYNERGKLFGFITFESEIEYNEILTMKSIAFGDDILRIEPGQDKGSMPTSVCFLICCSESYHLDYVGCDQCSQNHL